MQKKIIFKRLVVTKKKRPLSGIWGGEKNDLFRDMTSMGLGENAA